MTNNNFFLNYFKQINDCLNKVIKMDLEHVAELALKVFHKRKIICIGNGSGAAMASHVTVILLKAGIRAVNFNEADLDLLCQ